MISRFVSLLFVLLTPSFATAATVDWNFSLSFSDPVYVSHEYRTDLDCDSEIDFNITDEAYLKRDIAQSLRLHNISFSDTSQIQLRIYVTHYDCGSTGKESYRSYPLGFGFKETDYSSAYLRVVSELQDKKTGELIAMREFISVARLEKNSSQLLFFHFGTEEKNAQMSDLWKPIHNEIAKGIAEDIER